MSDGIGFVDGVLDLPSIPFPGFGLEPAVVDVASSKALLEHWQQANELSSCGPCYLCGALASTLTGTRNNIFRCVRCIGLWFSGISI